MSLAQPLTPCLWFDSRAEEAANFYCGIFPNSRITSITRYGEAGQEIHGQKPGSVMAVAFELDGQPLIALNGGPLFKFTEAVSFQVLCDKQADLEYYWEKLTAGGDPNAQQCGWLKDQFGLSWQVTPVQLSKMLADPDPAKSQRVMGVMLPMKKLDLAALEKAYRG